jgi:hypothetical protein
MKSMRVWNFVNEQANKRSKRAIMNGNPNSEQKRFHNNLREMGCIVTGAYQVEIHHIFGSKWKAKGFKKAGEWLVIPLSPEIHKTIKCYTFEWEREQWITAIGRHEDRFGYQPVPRDLIEYVCNMKHKQDITKGLKG